MQGTPQPSHWLLTTLTRLTTTGLTSELTHGRMFVVFGVLQDSAARCLAPVMTLKQVSLPRRPHDLLKVLNPKPEPFHIEIEAAGSRFVLASFVQLLQRHRNSLCFWQLPREPLARPKGNCSLCTSSWSRMDSTDHMDTSKS